MVQSNSVVDFLLICWLVGIGITIPARIGCSLFVALSRLSPVDDYGIVSIVSIISPFDEFSWTMPGYCSLPVPSGVHPFAQ